MGYPRGQHECAIGTVHWQMCSPTEIVVNCQRAVIHNIPYHANGRVRRLVPGSATHSEEGEWRMLCGDLNMRRLENNGDATLKAREVFTSHAERIAGLFDNEATKHQCRIAQLEEAKHNAEIDIENFEVKIDELRGTIEELDKQIAELKG